MKNLLAMFLLTFSLSFLGGLSAIAATGPDLDPSSAPKPTTTVASSMAGGDTEVYEGMTVLLNQQVMALVTRQRGFIEAYRVLQGSGSTDPMALINFLEEWHGRLITGNPNAVKLGGLFATPELRAAMMRRIEAGDVAFSTLEGVLGSDSDEEEEEDGDTSSVLRVGDLDGAVVVGELNPAVVARLEAEPGFVAAMAAFQESGSCTSDRTLELITEWRNRLIKQDPSIAELGDLMLPLLPPAAMAALAATGEEVRPFVPGGGA